MKYTCVFLCMSEQSFWVYMSANRIINIIHSGDFNNREGSVQIKLEAGRVSGPIPFPQCGNDGRQA